MKVRSSKITIVILVLILLISNISVSFAYSDPAYNLNYLGLLDNISEEELNQTMNRAVGIAMILKSLGYSQEQANRYAYKNEFADLENYSWLEGFAALATELNITNGTSENSFSPEEVLTKQHMLTFVLRSLGYDQNESWNNCALLAYEAGLIDNVYDIYDSNFTKREAADIIYRALSAKMQDESGLLLIEYLIDKGHVSEYIAKDLGLISLELTIESIKAINLSQIEITLNRKPYSGENVTNEKDYEFEGIVDGDEELIDIDDVDLDDNTIILTLEELVDHESVGTLFIDDDVFGKQYALKNIEFIDDERPEVIDAKVIDIDTIQVTFSEPIDFRAEKNDNKDYIARSKYNSEFDIKVDERTYLVYQIEVLEDGLKANVHVYGTLQNGNLTITVGDGLEDYAGLNISGKTFELTNEINNSPLEVVGYEVEDNDKVTLIFNQDISINSYDEDDYYHTKSSRTVDTYKSKADIEADDNKLILNFTDHELPDGTVNLYIKSNALTDEYGNENDEKITVKIKVSADSDEPRVKDVEVKYDDLIIIYFNMRLDEDTAEDIDNYYIEDEYNDKVKIRSIYYYEDTDDDEYTVELNLKDYLEEDVEYVIEIEDVESRYGDKMDDYDYEFTFED